MRKIVSQNYDDLKRLDNCSQFGRAVRDAPSSLFTIWQEDVIALDPQSLPERSPLERAVRLDKPYKFLG
jgi:hypothetical protein